MAEHRCILKKKTRYIPPPFCFHPNRYELLKTGVACLMRDVRKVLPGRFSSNQRPALPDTPFIDNTNNWNRWRSRARMIKSSHSWKPLEACYSPHARVVLVAHVAWASAACIARFRQTTQQGATGVAKNFIRKMAFMDRSRCHLASGCWHQGYCDVRGLLVSVVDISGFADA